MDYREKWNSAFNAYMKERGDQFSISAADLLKFAGPSPRHGDAWGNWRYDADVMVLTYVPEGYEISLEECNTSAETLDRIMQMSIKVWMNPTDLGHLVQAVHDLLDPQANLCSFGQDKKCDVRHHLKKLGKVVKN